MRADRLAKALIYSLLAVACDSSSDDERGAVADGGGSGGSGAGGSASSGGAGGSGGSAGSSGASAGSSGASAGSDGSGGSAGSAGDAGAGTGGASTDASADAPFDAASVNCSTNPPAWPRFDRACWEDSWCSVVLHQVDCCGSVVATGILHPEIEKFDAAEAVCRSQQGICDCAPRPTQTDTGQLTTDRDAGAVKVACRSGTCTTYLP